MGFKGRGIDVEGARGAVRRHIPTPAIRRLVGMRCCGSLQILHRLGVADLIMYRRTDARVWKDFEEGGVCAANPILSIDCGDGADHATQHLVAELAFTARRIHTLSHLSISTLDFPNRACGHE